MNEHGIDFDEIFVGQEIRVKDGRKGIVQSIRPTANIFEVTFQDNYGDTYCESVDFWDINGLEPFPDE